MTDPLEELENTSQVLPAAVAGVRLGDRATQRLQRFSDASRHELRLKAFVELAVLLNGRSDTQVKEQVGRALDAAFELSKAMEEVCDEQTLEYAFEEYPTFVQSLGVLEGQLRLLWTRMIDQQFAPLGSVGALLSAFPGARDLGLRMVQAAADARQHSQAPLIDLAPKVRGLQKMRETLVAEQQTVAGNPKVAAFLQALAANRATLDFLETEVLEWLKGQDALRSLKVTTAQEARNL
ncbi:hypothetical protein [Mesorhizobium sp. M1D.F.Ca.ET.043.01.1.1]|uniref:hypothetical protein n=1 Tax=Mesorhizobium sp. M1D.F.Ca.ET.043.01.1.1 TaxID=2493669 RepID=UPI000F762F75|nr:hypothetical protein [Mesorhizobium sp. M1D.F.Ca.ET.043.01.1.1]AZO73509.1 hypothetical protein EJ067_22065 [Mesorhizobium sp. M1D.F.Ca.ET.043.01.1.1]